MNYRLPNPTSKRYRDNLERIFAPRQEGSKTPEEKEETPATKSDEGREVCDSPVSDR